MERPAGWLMFLTSRDKRFYINRTWSFLSTENVDLFEKRCLMISFPWAEEKKIILGFFPRTLFYGHKGLVIQGSVFVEIFIFKSLKIIFIFSASTVSKLPRFATWRGQSSAGRRVNTVNAFLPSSLLCCVALPVRLPLLWATVTSVHSSGCVFTRWAFREHLYTEPLLLQTLEKKTNEVQGILHEWPCSSPHRRGTQQVVAPVPLLLLNF